MQITRLSADAVGVQLAEGALPFRSFRDFYAFEQHVKTARGRRGLEMIPEWYQAPVFYFSNATTLRVASEDLLAPGQGAWLDFELEVGAVIGATCRDVDPADALDHVLGFCVLNDWSLRDLQRDEMRVGLGPAKGKDFATHLGPVLVSPAALADRVSGKGYDLAMTARRNGQVISQGNWSSISYSFGELIARASQGVTLYPGELIGSGTVGTGCVLELGPENAGGWLRAGDIIELEIERLGAIRTTIR